MIISRWLTLFVLAAVVCGVVGCGGGGLTQAELKRRAFRRSSDDEEVDAPAPAKNAPPKDDEDDRDFGDDGDRRNIRAQGKEQVETKEEGPTIPEPTIPENLRDFDAEGKRALRIEWNIEEIGKAVQRHNKKFPSLPIGYNRGKSMGGWKPFLSWRVHLLPALGYQELYDKFNLDEPWNSPHNRALLKEMPPVYDCGLDKYRTTILALQRGLSTVWGTHKYVFHSQVEDGLDSTLIAQDCKDEYAVEWTRPLELDVIKYDPLQAISGRRFVLFANGSMGQLRQDVSPAMMLGLVTISGGEAVSPWEAVVIADADEVNAAGRTGFARRERRRWRRHESPLDDRRERPVEASLIRLGRERRLPWTHRRGRPTDQSWNHARAERGRAIGGAAQGPPTVREAVS